MPASESTGQRRRVILADDHPEILDEVSRILSLEFEVAGVAGDGIALMDLVIRLRPDAVVTDIFMPRMDGLRCAARLIQEKHCEAVVALSMHNDPGIVAAALAAGIRGFVLKEQAGEHLIDAIREAIAGRAYLRCCSSYTDRSPKSGSR